MFKLSIVTPEKIFFEDEVNSLIVPGSEGYLGVLSNHAPLITALKSGEIDIKDKDNNPLVLAVTGGFLEVSNNQASLLCDAAEFVDDIDIDRAKKAYENAKARIAEKDANPEADIILDVERAAMERAANRIRIYNHKKS